MNNFLTIIQNSMIARAQSTDYKLPGVAQVETDPSKVDLVAVEKYITDVTTLLLNLAGVVCLVLIMYSALMYALSYGDEAKVETAKKTMTWAIIGLIIVGLARFIVRFVTTELQNP